MPFHTSTNPLIWHPDAISQTHHPIPFHPPAKPGETRAERSAHLAHGETVGVTSHTTQRLSPPHRTPPNAYPHHTANHPTPIPTTPQTTQYTPPVRNVTPR